MKSVEQMLERCEGLVDTADISDWENKFLKSVIGWSRRGPCLTARETEKLTEIYNKHFAG